MNTPFRNPDPAGDGLPKATVFRALRSKLGGRPLPAAGGQPRRCTGARPNPSLAVGSRDFRRKHLEEPSIVGRGCFQVLSKGHSPSRSAKGRMPEPAPSLTRPADYLSSALAPASSSFFLP